MTRITFQDGKVLFQAGKVGTEAGCCCGQCAQPCPNYCGCEDVQPDPDLWTPPIPAFYSAGWPTGLPGYGFYDCNGVLNQTGNCQGRSVCQVWDFQFLCEGTLYQITIELYADLSCSETDPNHSTHPGCGTNCELRNIEMVVTGATDAPCYDPANIVFMVCAPCL